MRFFKGKAYLPLHAVGAQSSPRLRSILTNPRVTLILGFVVGAFFFCQLKDMYLHSTAVHHDLEDKLSTANRLVKEKLDIANFGGQSKRIAAIAEVAAIMTNNTSINQEPLDQLIEQAFPWWIQSKPIWTPWSHKKKGFKTKGASVLMTVGAGNAQLAANLIVGLRNVVGSKLPIEIAYSSNSDLPLTIREKLRALGDNIEMIDMTEVFDDEYIGLSSGGWAMKPFAMLASRYSQVILVDADTVMFESPDRLFEDHPGLRETGTLIYHDRGVIMNDHSRSDWVKELLEQAKREPSDQLRSSLFYSGEVFQEADSGMVAIDKSRPWTFMSLMFTAWMNSRVRTSVTYNHVYGDKETYWIAPELMGVDYFFQPWYAGQIGIPEPNWSELPGEHERMSICSRQMLHTDANATTPFWVNGGLFFDKSAPERGYVDWTHWWVGRPHEGADWAWIDDEFYSQWSCVKPYKSEVHELSLNFKHKIEKLIFECEKIEGLIPDKKHHSWEHPI